MSRGGDELRPVDEERNGQERNGQERNRQERNGQERNGQEGNGQAAEEGLAGVDGGAVGV